MATDPQEWTSEGPRPKYYTPDPNDPAAPLHDVFHDWVNELMNRLVPQAVDKAIEYGAVDLSIMGTAMEELLFDHDQHAVTVGEGVYSAIQFYLLGKVSRSVGALKHGRLPSFDTDDDMIVYALMAKYVRENGKWIG